MQVVCCDYCREVIGIGDEGRQNANTITFYSSDSTAGSTCIYRTFTLCDKCCKDMYDVMQYEYEQNVTNLKARFDE